MSLELLLETAWWAPALIWAALYVSDFTLTLLGHQAYRNLEGRFLQFDTYELTPFWKETVERSRWRSPRFALALAITTTVAALLGWWANGDDDAKMGAWGCSPWPFATAGTPKPHAEPSPRKPSNYRQLPCEVRVAGKCCQTRLLVCALS